MAVVRVTINGQPKDFTAPLNLYDVLAQENFIEMMIAVAKNNEIIPRDQWAESQILNGDILEIVAPMQGG